MGIYLDKAPWVETGPTELHWVTERGVGAPWESADGVGVDELIVGDYYVGKMTWIPDEGWAEPFGSRVEVRAARFDSPWSMGEPPETKMDMVWTFPRLRRPLLVGEGVEWGDEALWRHVRRLLLMTVAVETVTMGIKHNAGAVMMQQEGLVAHAEYRRRVADTLFDMHVAVCGELEEMQITEEWLTGFDEVIERVAALWEEGRVHPGGSQGLWDAGGGRE